MPRPPKFTHPLRALRAAIKKSQVQFAAMVGVKEITIRRIEGGTLEMSERLSRRISAATGVNREELLKGKAGVALNWFWRPYGPGDFEAWTTIHDHVLTAKQLAAGFSVGMAFWTDLLLQAAAESGNPKLLGVHQMLVDTLNILADDFQLRPTLKRLLEPYKSPIIKAGKMTFRENEFDPGWGALKKTEEQTPIVWEQMDKMSDYWGQDSPPSEPEKPRRQGRTAGGAKVNAP